MKEAFKVSDKIYKTKYINQSIKDFKDVTLVKYSKWELTIEWDSKDEIEEVFNEFMNYTLWLQIENS